MGDGGTGDSGGFGSDSSGMGGWGSDGSNGYGSADSGSFGSFGGYDAGIMGVNEGGFGSMDGMGYAPMGDTSMFSMFDPNGYSWAAPQDSASEAAMFGAQGYGETGGMGEFTRQYINPLQQFMRHPAVRVGRTALSFLAPPVSMGIEGINTLANMFTNPGKTTAGMFGSMAANAAGFPGMVGGALAGAAYDGISNPTQGGATNGGLGVTGPSQGGEQSWLNTGGTLGALYALHRGQNRSGDLASSLSGMFGPNSPYAQQLEQSLSRRDAAAGRRSQYGPRSVELQAKLAQMASGVAPSIGNANQSQLMQRLQMLNLLGMAGQQGAFRGLGDLFSNWGSGGGGGTNLFTDTSSSPPAYYEGMPWGG